MSDSPPSLSVLPRSTIAAAIRQVRQQIRWRPGRDQAHFEKRIRLGHLLPGTTLAGYELIIAAVLNDAAAIVYLFRFGDTFYPTVVASDQGRTWLVMFTVDGIMETAFPPDDPVSYFQNPKYYLYGLIQEVLS